MPTPGCHHVANISAKEIAILVVAKYSSSVLTLIRPKLLWSCSWQTPQTKETKTKGTTSNLRLERKTWPPKFNRPSTKNTCKKLIMGAGSPSTDNIHCTELPKIMASIIANKIRRVKFILTTLTSHKRRVYFFFFLDGFKYL